MNWWNNGGKTMPAGDGDRDWQTRRELLDSLGEPVFGEDHVRRLREYIKANPDNAPGWMREEEPPPGTIRRHRSRNRPMHTDIRTLKGDKPHFVREGFGMPGDVYQLDIGDVIEMGGKAFLVLKADPQWMNVNWLDVGGVPQLPLAEFYTGALWTIQPNLPLEFYRLKASPINMDQYDTTDEVGGSVYPGDEVIIDRTLYMVLKMNEDWMSNETNHIVRMRGGTVLASRLDGSLFGVSRQMKMEKIHYHWENY